MENYDTPALTSYGTAADLTRGGGTDQPEQQGGSSFPLTDNTSG